MASAQVDAMAILSKEDILILPAIVVSTLNVLVEVCPDCHKSPATCLIVLTVELTEHLISLVVVISIELTVGPRHQANGEEIAVIMP